jgi:type II secretory pathway pseudopilin PulG
MKMQQKLIICAAAAIVIGAVIALAAYLSAKDIKKVENDMIQQQAAEQQAAADAAQQQASSGSTSGSTSAPVATKLTYSQAVVKYADRRIQFDSNCVATPVISTFKNNTDVMLDNRAGVRRTITVDGTRHTVEGLDYKIVRMTAKTFPYTIQIDCGNGKNNANIYLQK